MLNFQSKSFCNQSVVAISPVSVIRNEEVAVFEFEVDGLVNFWW
jgi:hypothetical protein